jgi:hypothetical protein
MATFNPVALFLEWKYVVFLPVLPLSNPREETSDLDLSSAHGADASHLSTGKRL